jgi:hypothetical protein
MGSSWHAILFVNAFIPLLSALADMPWSRRCTNTTRVIPPKASSLSSLLFLCSRTAVHMAALRGSCRLCGFQGRACCLCQPVSGARRFLNLPFARMSHRSPGALGTALIRVSHSRRDGHVHGNGVTLELPSQVARHPASESLIPQTLLVWPLLLGVVRLLCYRASVMPSCRGGRTVKEGIAQLSWFI